MAKVWTRIRQTIERRGSAAMLSVIDAAGSVPRESGARIVLQPDGGFFGTIGGGRLEYEAMARAREGERGPLWFVTTEQTAGRGRRHRPWIAPRGNLASSILEVMDVAPAVAARATSSTASHVGWCWDGIACEARNSGYRQPPPRDASRLAPQ